MSFEIRDSLKKGETNRRHNSHCHIIEGLSQQLRPGLIYICQRTQDAERWGQKFQAKIKEDVSNCSSSGSSGSLQQGSCDLSLQGVLCRIPKSRRTIKINNVPLILPKLLFFFLTLSPGIADTHPTFPLELLITDQKIITG